MSILWQHDEGNPVMKISELDLPVRVENCLEKEFGDISVSELCAKSTVDILQVRDFGEDSWKRLKLALADIGLRISDDDGKLPMPQPVRPFLIASRIMADFGMLTKREQHKMIRAIQVMLEDDDK